MADDIRDRLHEATLATAARVGFRFSVEDVARTAGVSRATVYRYFPGGREQLVADGVRWEVARFFTRLHLAVHTEPDLASQLERALVEGHRLLEEHEVLHALLREEPEQFLVELEGPMAQVDEGLRAYLVSLLRREPVDDDVDVEEAAEYLARLYLTYLGYAGTWDLTDRVQVRRLVQTQFTPGILATDVTDRPSRQ